jgi:hypothetical protein
VLQATVHTDTDEKILLSPPKQTGEESEAKNVDMVAWTNLQNMQEWNKRSESSFN